MVKMIPRTVYKCPTCEYETSREEDRVKHEALPNPGDVFYAFPQNLVLIATGDIHPKGDYILWVKNLMDGAVNKDTHDALYEVHDFRINSIYEEDDGLVNAFGFSSLALKKSIEEGGYRILTLEEFEDAKGSDVLKQKITFYNNVRMEELIRTTSELEALVRGD